MNKPKILISIHPQWCEKIFNGEKTVEVRKTAPKIEPPFEVIVYCTKAKSIQENGLYLLPNDSQLHLGCEEKDLSFVREEGDFRNGTVIGSFVCNKVDLIEYKDESYVINDDIAYTNTIAPKSCLDYDDMYKYLGDKNGYGLHISELKIYDKPKELSEFKKVCVIKNKDCANCEFYSDYSGTCINYLTRPPQSWIYVEEV